MSDTWSGGCQCGAVRYRFTKKPDGAHVCHCRMCQKAFGAFYAPLVGARHEYFGVTRGEIAKYSSSDLVERGFCRDCGTPLTFAYDTPEARIYVTIGSMDDPELAGIEIQYGLEARISWVRFCEDVPGEITGDSPVAQEFFAGMKSNQG